MRRINWFPKIIGSISLGLSIFILVNVANHLPMPNVLKFIQLTSNEMAYHNPLAITISFGFGILALLMGLRAIIFDRVCIGEQCKIKTSNN